MYYMGVRLVKIKWLYFPVFYSSFFPADIPEYMVANEAINLGKRTDQRSYLVTGLIPNTGYRFRVRAINSFGRGKLASKPSGW